MMNDPRYEHVHIPDGAPHQVALQGAHAQFTKELHHIQGDHIPHHIRGQHAEHIHGADQHALGADNHHYRHHHANHHYHNQFGSAEHDHKHLPHLNIADAGHHNLGLMAARAQDFDLDNKLPEAVRKAIVAEHHQNHADGREISHGANLAHAHHARPGHFLLPSEAWHPQQRSELRQAHGTVGGDSPRVGGERPGVTGNDSPSKTGFGQKLLERLGLPVSEKNLQFLDAWARAEGGTPDNPLNTSQRMPGSHRFNGDGVQRYSSVEEGLEATVKTLTNGYYNNILKAMKKEDIPSAATALANGPWGTHNIFNFV